MWGWRAFMRKFWRAVCVTFSFLNRHLVQISAVLAVTALMIGGLAIERIADEAHTRVQASCVGGKQLRDGVNKLAKQLIELDGEDGSVEKSTKVVAQDIKALAEKPSPTCKLIHDKENK